MKVGIDLGTTNTLVSFVNEMGNICRVEFRNGRPHNKHLLPSCVAITENGFVAGQTAVEIKNNRPEHAVSNTKYFMGKDKSWTIGRQSINALTAATEILKEVMRELKAQFPEEKSFHAFVTVPARFDTQAPRLATKKALKNAGFECDEDNALTDEPVAAAIAYSRELDKTEKILVVDFGGGTFDLSLLNSTIIGFASTENRVEPLTWGGDLNLGGNDVDDILVSLMAKRIMEEKGVDLSKDARNIGYSREQAVASDTLKEKAVEIKKQLFVPENDSAYIFIPDLLDGYDFEFELTKTDYIDAMKNISSRMKTLIDELYTHLDINIGDTDKVLVVGGMAKECCLVSLLTKMFGKNKLLIPDDSLYLVSRGAAICNSNACMHVDSKAFSNIGVLVRSLQDVDIIVHEGQLIDNGFIKERTYQPDKDDAYNLTIKIVEFKGQFDKSRYNVVFSKTITLRKRMLFKKQNINARFLMSKDNLLTLELTQVDGTTDVFECKF